ncbi:histidine kinase [Pontibacillus halophilus JSM 076056 = DSM 19796]|uniref:Histidine kinase n=1 Tax=Pontibacillus halophilus JSM 076056 = DSM 19796 TaxID=1385510 RepID=A0A0A5GQG3_9BACI|nr:sensor domain-containing diguanylate cyclase [Pontibacillus halophilus]KGX93473.1 histidine kinase [Pontibacillus halophilus JSM 076056 = DSM 19796]
MVSKEKSIALWVIFGFVLPSVFVGVYILTDPILAGRGYDLYLFALLICIVSFFPIIVNGTPVFFIQGIALAVFLCFGLFYEMLLTQIASLVFFATLRLRRHELHRVPINMLMFVVVSLASATVYYLLGGINYSTTSTEAIKIVPIIGYSLTVFITNQLLLHWIRNKLLKQNVPFFEKSLVWEFVTTLAILPIGVLLFMMYTEVGRGAVVYVGLPFVTLSVILKLYHSSRRVNDFLEVASDIGHDLAAKLKVSEVLDRFIERIIELVELDYLFIFDVEDEQRLSLYRFYDSTGEITLDHVELQKGEGISGKTLEIRQGLFVSTKKEWRDLESPFVPTEVESIMSLPMIRHNRVVGVVTIASKRKRGFEKLQYRIIDLLTNYLAVSIQNARNYERTKQLSERCPLTNLYNYRYLESQLQSYIEDSHHEILSMILLDLDHFKSVNDTYGHESGNEILCMLADRLTSTIGDQGIVARYGGEEFVMLLPGVQKEHSMHIAENVRRKLAHEPFPLHQHILGGEKDVQAYVTASIGVASFPMDCDDPSELIRQADRAMYVGAKQKGRNKVASYEQAIGAAE